MGYTVDIPISDVEALDPQFCVLPAQALNCSLKSIVHLVGTWSLEYVKKFQEVVLEQDVQVTFLRGAVSRARFDVQLEFKGKVQYQRCWSRLALQRGRTRDPSHLSPCKRGRYTE